MDKYEFLTELRRALSGHLTQPAIEEHIRYYEDYIDIRLRTGDTPEILQEKLGDPRLLAKTLITAKEAENEIAPRRFVLKLLDKVQDFWNRL